MTALIAGLAFSGLVVLMWGGGVLYVRRMRHKMNAESGSGDVVQAQLTATAEEVHSIEEWIARANALPEGKKPEPRPEHQRERDQAKLAHIAEHHFPHIAVPHPHIHLMGITGLEKRLLAWVSDHTGLPNPFDALDRLTGDPDELRRAAKTWEAAHDQLTTAIADLCTATAKLHMEWNGDTAERFYPLLADFLSELDTLAANIQTSADTVRGLQAEAALAEGTIAGLVNLLVGSLGGFLVEEVMTVGTMTPAVAAQAHLEITWVLKQIAMAAGKLQGAYSNTRHVLDSVVGFKGMSHMRDCFQLDVVQKIERTIDAQ